MITVFNKQCINIVMYKGSKNFKVVDDQEEMEQRIGSGTIEKILNDKDYDINIVVVKEDK